MKDTPDLTPEQLVEYQKWSDRYGTLGLDLQTAWLKYRMMVSFRTAEKNYSPGEANAYWKAIAELVSLTAEDDGLRFYFISFLKELRTIKDGTIDLGEAH